MVARKNSAGLLVYRVRDGGLEVFLVHPGGPYWSNKDAGAWSIPKGEVEDGEDLLVAARREFHEETGFPAPAGALALTPVKQPSGKVVHVWAAEGSPDPAAIRSNTFSMEWPPRSGRKTEFPEVDRAQFFSIGEARDRILSGQAPLLDELERRLKA